MNAESVATVRTFEHPSYRGKFANTEDQCNALYLALSQRAMLSYTVLFDIFVFQRRASDLILGLDMEAMKK